MFVQPLVLHVIVCFLILVNSSYFILFYKTKSTLFSYIIPPSFRGKSRNLPTFPIKKDDFVSPISMKQACDFHYGTMKQPGENLTVPFDVDLLFNNSVIFVDANDLSKFVHNELYKLKLPFTIVTGDGDRTVGRHSSWYESITRYSEKLAQHPLLVHWFSMNCGSMLHPTKFSCIPNGISQWDHQREVMAELFQSSDNILRGNPKTTKKMVLASFSKRSHPSRYWAWNYACKLADSLCYFNGSMVRSYQGFLRLIPSYERPLQDCV